MLKELYEDALKLGSHELEVVFCSSDNDAESFGGYFGEMPWVAIPYDSSAAREALGARYGVRGIPALIVLDRSDRVLDGDGRSTVAAARGNAQMCLDKWGGRL